MKKFFALYPLLALMLLGIVMLSAACRGPAPTSTPVPPTSNAPTALPPAPTAPPLTEAPTAVLPTAAPTAVLPTNAPPPATAVPPTSAPPAPTNTSTAGVATPIRPPTTGSGGGAVVPTADRGPLTGLYVSSLRYDPTYPVKNTPIMFYATLVNRTGKEQYYPVCAEIFRPGEKKSFGISNCDNLTIVPGSAEVFIGSWIASGIKECIPVRARVVLREQEEDDVRFVFTTTNGGELWTDFNMCP